MNWTELVRGIHGDRLDIVSVSKRRGPCVYKKCYANCMCMDATFKCNACGDVFTKPMRTVIHGRRSGCPACSKAKVLKTKGAKTLKLYATERADYIEKKFKNLKVQRRTIRNTPTGYKGVVECKVCGVQKERFLKSVAEQVLGCQVCSLAQRQDERARSCVKRAVKNLKPQGYKLLSPVPDTITVKVGIKCKCGTTFSKTLKQVETGSSGCPKCGLERSLKAPKRKSKAVKLGKRIVNVTGYEPQALAMLREDYKAKDIRVTKDVETPIIRYTYGNKVKRYFPDFYVVSVNGLVEVKSLWSAGLLTCSDTSWEILKAKRAACMEQGYKFRMMLITSRGYRMKVPPEVWKQKRRQALATLRVANSDLPPYELGVLKSQTT